MPRVVLEPEEDVRVSIDAIALLGYYLPHSQENLANLGNLCHMLVVKGRSDALFP